MHKDLIGILNDCEGCIQLKGDGYKSYRMPPKGFNFTNISLINSRILDINEIGILIFLDFGEGRRFIPWSNIQEIVIDSVDEIKSKGVYMEG